MPNTFRSAVLLAGTVVATLAGAATLPFDAPLHESPSLDSPVVATLPSGASVNALLRDELAAAGIPTLPTGWIAMRYTTAGNGYVRNKDVGKDFSMKPDSPVFSEAAEDSPVLATVGPNDAVDIGDPVGRFSRATFPHQQIVYLSPVPPGSRGNVTTVYPDPSTAPAPEVSSAPLAPPTPPANVTDTPVPAAARSASSVVTAAPRTFDGYLMRTRRILGRGPKLDYQLVDENGKRIALLDVSALLLTDPLEFFEGRKVSIYGPGVGMEGVTDAIIRVENLRLAR